MWAAGGLCALAIGLALGLASGMLVLAPWLGPGSPWASILAVLVGGSVAVLVGITIGGWWNGLLERRLRLLHKLHPGEIEQWGGEAMLSDRLAIEGLLEVMERESN